jgi:hypothetical protein
MLGLFEEGSTKHGHRSLSGSGIARGFKLDPTSSMQDALAPAMTPSTICYQNNVVLNPS